MDSPRTDTLGRPMRDLRISVIDRCNLRCRYCMPSEVFDKDHVYLPKGEILSYEEIARLVGVFAGLGVEKVRLTGGEPLLRRDLPTLVRMVSQTPGVRDVALTTNGLLLPGLAAPLYDEGLSRLTVSLDSLNDATLRAICDRDVTVVQILDGIRAAERAGFTRVKINMVVMRGVNDSEIVDMARHFKGSGHTVRFIEYMDVGTTNGWRMDQVVPAAEVVARIGERFTLEPVAPDYPGEVATRWRYTDGSGEIGVIASVTAPFCGNCTRTRLSAKGELFTCLFASRGIDLRGPMRLGVSDTDLRDAISAVWGARRDRFSEERAAHGTNAAPEDQPVSPSPTSPKIEMSYIGG